MKGKTKSGFKYTITESRMDDMELLDKLAELEENPLLLGTVCGMFLGKEQKKALYEHCRNEDGVVKATVIEKELVEIMTTSTEGKNS